MTDSDTLIVIKPYTRVCVYLLAGILGGVLSITMRI